jgi:hypothetical protein
MALFDIDVPDAQVGYLNIKAAQFPTEALIKQGLEELWTRYEPYADAHFRTEFAKQPEPRFWEMYLAVQLLNARKKILSRDQLPAAQRDEGPDICIPKGKRKIWIEALAPDRGEPSNLDQVPDLFAASAEGQAQDARRQVELRITSALLKKRDAFQEYRDKGIVAEEDSCVVAISAAEFALQAVDAGLPHAVTAVYPFGQEHFVLDPNGPRVVSRGHEYSAEIRRLGDNRGPIPRTAFQHEHFAGISGIIWSRRAIGNFLGQPDDFMFIHNDTAEKSIPRGWFRWLQEFFPNDEGTTLTIRKRRSQLI